MKATPATHGTADVAPDAISEPRVLAMDGAFIDVSILSLF